MNSNKLAIGILATGLAVLAGCANSSSGSGQLVSEEAAAATAAETTAIATSMTESQTTATGGAEVARSVNASPDNTNCASVDVTTSGSSGWTAETLTFAAPPCQFTGYRGNATLDITGALALTRSNGDGYNFTSNATNLEWALVTNGATYSETRNGTRAITASASGASAASNITVSFAGAVHNGTLTHQLTASFTPAAGSSLAAGEPLPSGNFSYTGAATWAGSDNTAGTFSITTVTPLAYNASCAGAQPSVFDSGEIHLHLTSVAGNAYAKVTWSDCAAPSISFVAE